MITRCVYIYICVIKGYPLIPTFFKKISECSILINVVSFELVHIYYNEPYLCLIHTVTRLQAMGLTTPIVKNCTVLFKNVQRVDESDTSNIIIVLKLC